MCLLPNRFDCRTLQLVCSRYRRHLLAAVSVLFAMAWIYSYTFGASDARIWMQNMQRFLREEELTCQPKTNIACVKMPKCASTTTQNILYRYALSHNLTVLLPNSPSFSLGLLSDANSEMNRMRRALGVNIFDSHCTWNHQRMSALMPEDTVFLTTLRDPIERSRSAFYFAGSDRKQSLEQYVTQKRIPEGPPPLGRNHMLKVLGLPEQQLADLEAVRKHAEVVEGQFDLVMLVERMDESLVLLKHLLCWTTEDMVSLKLKDRLTPRHVEDLSSAARAKLRHFLTGDYILYDHFSAVFQRHVDRFGQDRMQQEVVKLREAREIAARECQFQKVESSQLLQDKKLVLFADKQRTVYGYVPTHRSVKCDSLAYTAVGFNKKLHEVQLKRMEQMKLD